MPQGHPGQLLCWDRGLHHLCSKRGKCAYALSQCTQQGEAHPIYLVTCSLFWMVGGKWFSHDWASKTDGQTKWLPVLDSDEPWMEVCNWLRSSSVPLDTTILNEVLFMGQNDICFWFCSAHVSNFFLLHKLNGLLSEMEKRFVISDITFKHWAKVYTRGMYSSVAYCHKVLSWLMIWTSGSRPGLASLSLSAYLTQRQ